MKIGFSPRRKLFQTQAAVAADAPEVVGVGDDHLRAVGGWRIVAIAALGIRRDPVGRAVEQRLVAAALVLERHAHRVLLRFLRLVLLDEADHAVLPLGRARVVLVGDLVEHVVEIVDRVDDLADVGLLQLGDLRAAASCGFPGPARRRPGRRRCR